MVVLFNGGGAKRVYSSAREKKRERRTESFCREGAKEGEKGKNVQGSRLAARKMGRESYILAPKIDRFDGLYDSLNRLRYLQENLIIGGPGNLDARSKSFIVVLTTAPTFHSLRLFEH